MYFVESESIVYLIRLIKLDCIGNLPYSADSLMRIVLVLAIVPLENFAKKKELFIIPTGKIAEHIWLGWIHARSMQRISDQFKWVDLSQKSSQKHLAT